MLDNFPWSGVFVYKSQALALNQVGGFKILGSSRLPSTATIKASREVGVVSGHQILITTALMTLGLSEIMIQSQTYAQSSVVVWLEIVELTMLLSARQRRDKTAKVVGRLIWLTRDLSAGSNIHLSLL